mmetsp:Transcript_47396/g.40004  ORF Transcript_47396/g.40004 Transcript_47396/m.40004 type:complete len:207 (-) Transcript_47396:333-953(-)
MIEASNKNPAAVSALTGFTLTAIGGHGSQQLFIGAENRDLKRSLETACWSAITSPLMLNWYRKLENALPGAKLKAVIAKSLLTLVATLGINNPCHSFYSSAIRSKFHNEIVDWKEVGMNSLDKMRNDLPELYKNGQVYWIPVQTISYAVVPDKLRVLWSSTCTVGLSELQTQFRHRIHQTDDTINKGFEVAENFVKKEEMDKYKGV